MSKKKTECLNELFSEWLECLAGYCYRDGIIDEGTFERQKLKLLFLAKEPHGSKDPQKDQKSAHDYRDSWKDCEKTRYTFARRIAKWACVCLDGCDSIPDTKSNYDNWVVDQLKRIAFMNIKKTGGGSVSGGAEIAEFVEKHRNFLLRQIQIISPDIIIGSIGQKNFEKLFPTIKFVSTGCRLKSRPEIQVARFDKYKIIDFYHPSARRSPDELQCLLRDVIKSDVFLNL